MKVTPSIQSFSRWVNDMDYQKLRGEISTNTPKANLINLKNPTEDSLLGLLGTSPPPFQKNLGEEEGQVVSHDAVELGTVKIPRPNQPPFYVNLDLALIRELLTAARESGGHGESEESVISAYLEECRKNPDFMAAWLQDARAWKAKQQAKLMPVSMPKEIPVLRRCHTCKHHSHKLHYCGGNREDLPLAYGVNHPLRKLPKDNGATCGKWLDADSKLSIDVGFITRDYN